MDSDLESESRDLESESWERINEILLEALEHAPAQRTVFLHRACGDDDELRREVESLLASDSEPELMRRVERPSFDLLGRSAMDEGQRIGPYQVVREIDRGGMGTVYLAVRADDEYERRVAIKVLRRDGDSAEISHRFRIERQILARLDHPNIAKLYESGTTADDRLYFVMEYVEGERIDLYCDRHRLTLRQRLELFRKVLTAVQFAHQNLVVHRDLKPGNILVTADGEPKLLDFGIAKLLQPEPGLSATVTGVGQRLMTPEYASPEQVCAEPITTASDVYSLGVLLYELLTGHLPYRLKSRQQEEIQRVICGQEPDKPSSAVSRVEEIRARGGTPVELTPAVVSRARGEEPRRLRRRLSGDLDNIVLMALRKEPQHRYASVEQLSGDLRRHLEGRPVRAHKDTFAYRTGKFLVRRKKVVAAALFAILFLAGGVRYRELQQREITRARDRAQRVSEFLIELFEISDPSEARGNSVTAREILDRGARRIGRQLREEPELQAALMNTMGQVYMKLGLYETAAPLLETALAQRREVYGEHPEVAESLRGMAALRFSQGDYDAAEPFSREALAMTRELLGAEHRDIAGALNDLAMVRYQKGDYERAEALFHESLAMQRRLPDASHRDVTATLENLAILLRDQGDYDGAEPLFRESLAIGREHLGSDHPSVARALNNLALLLYSKEDYATAEPLFRESLAMARELLGDEHPNVARPLNNLALTLQARGEYDAAESLLRESLAIRRKHLGADHPGVALALNSLALLLYYKGDYDAAEPLFRESLAMARQLLGDEHLNVARALSNLALVPQARGDYDAAESLLRESLAIRSKHLDADHPDVARILCTLAVLLQAQGEYVAAEPLAREAVHSLRRKLPPGDWRIANAESIQGASLSAVGRFEEAEPLLIASYPVIRDRRGEQAQETVAALDRIIASYEAWGKPEKAAAYQALLPAP